MFMRFFVLVAVLFLLLRSQNLNNEEGELIGLIDAYAPQLEDEDIIWLHKCQIALNKYNLDIKSRRIKLTPQKKKEIERFFKKELELILISSSVNLEEVYQKIVKWHEDT